MTRGLALITGGNAGIGRATARQLLERDWEVVIASRRAEAGAAAVAALRRYGPVSCVDLDLARLDSVRACAGTVVERWPRVDALINNAGTVRSGWELSADGFELTLQTNHLGHFLLTHLLRGALSAAERPRVVNVSSTMHTRSRGIDFDDLQMQHNYGAVRAYADTKLANVYFTRELARRWPELTSYAVHPGGVRTELGGGGELRGPAGWGWWLVSRFMRSPGSGAKPVTRLATGELRGTNGAYFHRFEERAAEGVAADAASASRLWEVSRELAGV